MTQLLGLRASATCGSCGSALSADSTAPTAFCPACGTCLLRSREPGPLHAFVPPKIGGEAAWLRLRSSLPEAARSQMTAARLLLVPFHEWPPDPSARRIARDARAVLAPAADLAPAGLVVPISPLGGDRRGLAVAESAHRGRLTDPEVMIPLIRQGEEVDVMLPAPPRAPAGGDPSAAPHLLYYPFWFFTFRIDWKEHRGVVDAFTGSLVGPSSPPRRWRSAIIVAAAGFAVTAAIVTLGATRLTPSILTALTAAASWAAAWFALSRRLRRERAR